MAKRVLSVGQCSVDHAAICRLIEGRWPATVVPAASPEEALAALRAGPFDLVLVNRKLDADYSDGVEVIRRIKEDPAVAGVPVMLLTNYAEHQATAVAAGAEPGFGKLEYDEPATRDKLARFLA
jgi:two-component system chemotaxis response regulator CheY